MAIALFKHHFVGKSAQPEPYKTAAHHRYIARKSAAMRVFSEHMPKQWHAVQRFLKEHEDGLRKNGRVADTFIIAIPREFTPDAAEKVLRQYGNRIGKGKAPFLVAFHWDEHNPHAHMIFLDRDPETGRRVFGTTVKGSTDLLKLEWQDEVNAMFQQLGLETEIQFGGKLEAVNDNVNEPSPTETTVVEEPPSQEEQLAVIEQEELDQRQQYSLAASAVQDLRQVRRLQKERQAIRDTYEGAYQAHQKAQDASRQAAAELAQAGLDAVGARDAYIQEHRGVFGKKGFAIKAFGFSYQSPARKAADAAELAYQQAQERADAATKLLNAENANLAIRLKDFELARQRVETIQGSDQELSDAELIFEQTVAKHAGNLTPELAREAMMNMEMEEETAALLLEELGFTEEAKKLSKDYGQDV